MIKNVISLRWEVDVILLFRHQIDIGWKWLTSNAKVKVKLRSSTLHVAVVVVLSSSGIKYGRKISVNHPPSVLKIWNLWWEIMWKNISYRCCATHFSWLHKIFHEIISENHFRIQFTSNRISAFYFLSCNIGRIGLYQVI